ncbi:sulfite exporter TauE/SafE family protein [Bacteroidota bacterium]
MDVQGWWEQLIQVIQAYDLAWYKILAVIGVGVIAGFINTVAGSGSLLTLPLLMFLGLPPNVANGTNRIAILLQNVVSVSSFKKQKVLDFRDGIKIGIPAVIGSLIGARIAVNLNDALMEKMIGGLLVLMFFLIILKPNRWLKGQEGQSPLKIVWQALIFFFIGIYGGFIQAGVGFFLLAGLVLGSGFDLVKANALKVFIVFLYTPFALAIFILNGDVNYVFGFILAIGNMLGAFFGARVAVKWGAPAVRIFLLVALFFASLKLLGVFDLIL